MNALHILCLLGLVAVACATGTGTNPKKAEAKPRYRNMIGRVIPKSALKPVQQQKQEKKKTIADLSRPDTTEYISNLHHYIDSLHTAIDQMSAIQTAGSISFTAVRTSNLGPVSQDTVVTFSNIDVNIGGHFQSSSAFHVPLDGLYFFTYKYHGSDVIVNLMKKIDDPTAGTVVQTSSVGDGALDASGGGSIVLDLLVGNQIYLNLPAGTGTNLITADATGQQIAFSGFLLYQRV